MKKLKGFYSVLIQSRPHVSYSSPTDEKSVSDCAELAGMHRSLRTVSDIMGYSVACFSQNCSGLLKLSRWHLQTLRPIVSSPYRCGFNTNSSFFSLNRLSMWTVFGSDISLRRDSATEYTDNVYLSCLPCPRQLSRYSSHAANGKLASFSAASCWCGVVWIWQYQRHSKHVMTQTAPLMAACLPFTTSSSKTIMVVKFRRTDVFMRGQVSEIKWDINSSW